MKLLLLLSTLSTAWKNGSGFSFPKCSNNGMYDAALLSQRAVLTGSSQMFPSRQPNNKMSVPTRRDTIKMPSQTPMVPWKVSNMRVDKPRNKSHSMSRDESRLAVVCGMIIHPHVVGCCCCLLSSFFLHMIFVSASGI
jgi:hypothetical protein